MKTCTRCGLTKALSEFYFRKDRNVPGSYCKVCHAELNVGRVGARRRNVKLSLVEEHGRKCVDCGYVGPPFMYDFDHRVPTEKSFTISASKVLGIEALRAEAAKCDLVCSNCHRMRTHKQRCTGCEWCS